MSLQFCSKLVSSQFPRVLTIVRYGKKDVEVFLEFALTLDYNGFSLLRGRRYIDRYAFCVNFNKPRLIISVNTSCLGAIQCNAVSNLLVNLNFVKRAKFPKEVNENEAINCVWQSELDRRKSVQKFDWKVEERACGGCESFLARM